MIPCLSTDAVAAKVSPPTRSSSPETTRERNAEQLTRQRPRPGTNQGRRAGASSFVIPSVRRRRPETPPPRLHGRASRGTRKRDHFNRPRPTLVTSAAPPAQIEPPDVARAQELPPAPPSPTHPNRRVDLDEARCPSHPPAGSKELEAARKQGHARKLTALNSPSYGRSHASP